MTREERARRVIFHLDMDAFFVSVEELSDPSLKGKPVVVGGKPGERGVVAAASYEARKFGIHSAMPLQQAYRRCPRAVFLEGRPHKYLDYSHRVKSIVSRFSPLVAMASIDEAYLDLTGTDRLFGPPLKAAHSLHAEVASETSLPCSIGIGTSRLVAKIGSGLAKPNGVLYVEPGCEAAFLAPLEVGRVPGVGKVMREKLRNLGITTIGEAQRRGETFLELQFGKAGLALAGKARGLDAGAWFSPGFSQGENPKSISHETTFRRDTRDRVVIDATLAKLAQLVARRLREHGLWARTVQVKIRYEDFSTHTRAKTLAEATQLDKVILGTIRSLFSRHRLPNRAIRLLGVHAGSLQSGPEHQESLFETDGRKKWSQALRAVDALRDRFGESSVGLAATLGHARRERVHENPSGLAGRGTRRGK